MATPSVELWKFLHVAASSDQPVAPSVRVDAEWHALLADTRAYDTYCESEFGRRVPHVETELPVRDAYERTRQSLQARFGSVDERLWPPDGAAVCFAGPAPIEVPPPPPPPGG